MRSPASAERSGQTRRGLRPRRQHRCRHAHQPADDLERHLELGVAARGLVVGHAHQDVVEPAAQFRTQLPEFAVDHLADAVDLRPQRPRLRAKLRAKLTAKLIAERADLGADRFERATDHGQVLVDVLVVRLERSDAL